MSISYKHPCIEEVICELTFAPDPAVRDIDLTLPGNLQNALGKDSYPGPTRNVVNRSHMIDAAGSALQITEQLFRVQLPSKGDRSIISIGRDVVSVSRLRPYDGWDNFKPEITRVFAAWFSVATPRRKSIRVGLRYINRLITPRDKPIDHWLTDVSPPISANAEDGTVINAALKAVNNRREFTAADGTRLMISLATLEPETPATAEYLIDIDVIADTPPLDDTPQIIALIDKLHLVTGAVFETMITDNTRRLLNAV